MPLRETFVISLAMSEKRKEFSLDSLRTDGWFERIGEGIGSFQALCEIVGERFFAFSIIVGARITALTVDRRSPDQTLVDFVVGVGENEGDLDPQRLTLADFRRRLVGALLVEEDREAPRPTRETDVEAIQLYVGVRYLLLAPLYGYSLRKLILDGKHAELRVLHDGAEETFALDTFRMRVRALVREELDRVATGARSAIDLSKVAEAEAAAIRKEWPKVIALLGAWPAPLAIFLRTPEGQMLGADARSLIAKGLGLLGSACVHLGEVEQAEEVFRIGIQYAQEGVAAAELFRRLGEALLLNDRAGEAIGPLRRALAFGGAASEVMPPLARAFLKRGRYVAAYACLRDALDSGVAERELVEEIRQVEGALGPSLTAWRARKIEAKKPRDAMKSQP
jgi:tetratricopeptide (TPR) repeat protein